LLGLEPDVLPGWILRYIFSTAGKDCGDESEDDADYQGSWANDSFNENDGCVICA
jgi:hypothetical protein